MQTKKETVNERMSKQKEKGRTGGIKASVRKIRRVGEEAADSQCQGLQ